MISKGSSVDVGWSGVGKERGNKNVEMFRQLVRGRVFISELISVFYIFNWMGDWLKRAKIEINKAYDIF